MTDFSLNNGFKIDLLQLNKNDAINPDDKFLKKYDKNGNSIWDEEEIKQFNKDIKKYDKNGDGTIDKNESLNWFTKIMGKIDEQTRARFDNEETNDVFNSLKSMILQGNEETKEITNNKNITTEQSKQTTSTQANIIPAALSQEEITELTKYNDIQYKDQKGVKIGEQWYDFDSKGRCTRIYNQPPQNDSNNDPNSYIYIAYDASGNVKQMFRYLDGGKLQADGTKTCCTYNADGTLVSYDVISGFTYKNNVGSNSLFYDNQGHLIGKYQINEHGNPTNGETYINNQLSSKTTITYKYSGNKIIEEKSIGKSNGRTTTTNRTFKYSGDNVTEQTVTRTENGITTTTITTFKYSGDNVTEQTDATTKNGITTTTTIKYSGDKVTERTETKTENGITTTTTISNIPQSLTQDDIADITKYNDIQYKDQKGVKIGEQWYDFDSEGRCISIYNQEPQQDDNGESNAYTRIEYDDSGKISKIYQYLDGGKIQADGTRTCCIYYGNGTLENYYVESRFKDGDNLGSIKKVYDSDGSLIDKKQYDDHGNMTNYEYYENGELKSKITTTYKYSGDKISEQTEITTEDGKTTTTITTYKYSGDDVIEETEIRTENGITTTTITKYSGNNISEVTETKTKNGITTTTTTKYSGNNISEVTETKTKNGITTTTITTFKYSDDKISEQTEIKTENGKTTTTVTAFKYSGDKVSEQTEIKNENGKTTTTVTAFKYSGDKLSEQTDTTTQNNKTTTTVTTFKYSGDKLSEKTSIISKNGKTNTLVTRYDDENVLNSYEKDEAIEDILSDFCANIDNLNEEKLQEFLDKIYSADIDLKHTNFRENKNMLRLYRVFNYAAQKGINILEEIANRNQALADKLIQQITEAAKQGDVYTQDIENDMAQHPTDYKKLSVDIQRITGRADNYEGHEDEDDNSISANGEFDVVTEQQHTGNCYLLSSVEGFYNSPKGKELLKSIRKDNLDGSVTINMAGGKSYTFTKEEINSADYLSSGDPDLRVYELAMDKYRRDMSYENHTLPIDGGRGNLKNVITAFFGKDIETSIEAEDIDSCNPQDSVINFSIDECNHENLTAKKSDNTDVDLHTDHQYMIKEIKNGIVYFTNPWDSGEILHITLDEFKQLEDLYIEKADFDQLKS